MGAAGPLIGGVLGFLLGQGSGQPPQQWQELQQEVQERMNHLTYMEVGTPLGFYEGVRNARELHAEAIGTYLLGFRNASIPMSFRCLEVGLANKYEQVEEEEPEDMSSYRLLEHFEDEFGETVTPLQWFRQQRNKIHTTELVDEADALEAIRHTTEGLNILYPRTTGFAYGDKACCGESYEVEREIEEFYLGNVLNIRCEKCRQTTPHRVLPAPLERRI